MYGGSFYRSVFFPKSQQPSKEPQRSFVQWLTDFLGGDKAANSQPSPDGGVIDLASSNSNSDYHALPANPIIKSK